VLFGIGPLTDFGASNLGFGFSLGVSFGANSGVPEDIREENGQERVRD